MAEEKKKQGAPQQKEGASKGGGAKPAAGGGQKGAKPAAGAKGKGDKGKAEVETGVAIKRTQPPRLKQLYDKEVAPRLMKEFGFDNQMEVPKLVKITINMGLGEAIGNPKVIDSAVEELRTIAGQAPVVTTAKKSIATFKLRAGQKIGTMVTLRRERMWEFFERLVSFALPRVRDFKGISQRAFDGRGNFSMGIREQIIFPEINYDRIDKIKGLNVSIVTTARTDEEGRALLRYLGMPFRS
jgi:large subunit ribosomal protein L5